MKSPFDFFEKYLPKKCSKQNPLNPIIYIYDGEKLLGLYSFSLPLIFPFVPIIVSSPSSIFINAKSPFVTTPVSIIILP